MLRIRQLVATTALLLCFGAAGASAQTATQTASFQVDTIDEISVSGDPATLVINSATAGSAPNSATNAATSYAVTTNVSNRKITAAIDLAMPSGLTLNVSLAAPSGATSTARNLTATAQDVVTGISTLNESGLTITYTLSATSAAAPQSGSRTVTYTITAGA
jgi:hypothetical protein